ncbi:hypothetical protein AUJ64_01295 [Candidatus Pacearchaeota archaeon CG1_02_39_14]|nr:MAG: hypothetical protein AUJ64_01295 [Candidatus Pacearchaeota archaeon CG1_02_39_14]
MLALFLFILIPNRNRLFDSPKGKVEGVSIVMPCYNESEHIGKAIESLLNLDWPKNKLEIIIVDDKSSDNSVEVISKYVKKYPNVRLIVNEKNSGGAAEPTNKGVLASRFDYIAVADADSTPSRDALRKMIGFLQEDTKVGGVTCAVLADHPKNFMQKVQAIEYSVIAFNRKLLDMVDAVYVTPGPFALYRKKILIEVGLFDKRNLTQDIEIVWRMLSYGYMARMCLGTKVYSVTPKTFKGWWKQRLRWNIGGKQTLWKYKGLVFRKGMLGSFIIPFFSVSLFLGVFGLGLFFYLLSRRALVSYLSTKYSIYASSTIVRLQDLTFAPSILNFFGLVLFILGLSFTFLGLFVINDTHVKKGNIFNIFFYLIIYLAIYPFNLIHSLYQMARGKYSW